MNLIRLFSAKKRFRSINNPWLRFWRRSSNNWAFTTTLILFVVLIAIWVVNPRGILDTFFGATLKTPAEILTFIGAICGAILLLGNQYTANKRNLIIEKGQLDIRFKDAANLLASENTSAILSGVFALHQISIEASKEPSQHGYVSVNADILCAFIRENKKIENDGNGNDVPLKSKIPIIVFQTIIKSLLSRNDGKLIYNPSGINFKDSDLNYVDFFNLYGISHFTKVDLSEAILSGANLNGAYLREANLSEANLSGAYLREANLSKANLREANLSKAYLREAKLYRADLSEADLSGADLNEADLGEADLSGANVSGANVSGADLRGANVSGANVSGANVRGANLRGANLRGANVRGANVSGANVSGADLSEADLRGAIIDKNTIFTRTKFENYSKEQLKEVFVFEEDE